MEPRDRVIRRATLAGFAQQPDEGLVGEILGRRLVSADRGEPAAQSRRVLGVNPLDIRVRVVALVRHPFGPFVHGRLGTGSGRTVGLRRARTDRAAASNHGSARLRREG